MLKVLYLVHDLGDATVRKRLEMLRAGGADVCLAGFHRAASVANIEGVAAIGLGRTHDGNFRQRMSKVLAVLAAGLSRRIGGFEPDVIIARNLEMLVLAASFRSSDGGRPRLVYEMLDIHRLLLDRGPIGSAMRALERKLLDRVCLVLTSSTAFVDEYLRPEQKLPAPILLLENKVLRLKEPKTPSPSGAAVPARPSSGPVVIGWFGALRCARSLALLAAFTRAMQGRYEVVLRGRPAYREFDNFDSFVRHEPFMRFEGPYKSPEDLGRIYASVDLVWAIDFFEEGLNSQWLLPNRLYEGCLHGGVPVAMAGTQTARFLRDRGIGLIIEEASVEALAHGLEGADLERLREAVLSLDESIFVSGAAECSALVSTLAGAGAAAPFGVDTAMAS